MTSATIDQAGVSAPSTATHINVPVQTWKAKAILAGVISGPLPGLHETCATHVGFTDRLLVDDQAADHLIDHYMESKAPIETAERLLSELRAVVPGPDASLQVPVTFELMEKLSGEIDVLSRCVVSEFLPHVQVPTQREIAEGTIVAIDLRDLVASVEEMI